VRSLSVSLFNCRIGKQISSAVEYTIIERFYDRVLFTRLDSSDLKENQVFHYSSKLLKYTIHGESETYQVTTFINKPYLYVT
jgi:hypothetical protein